MASSIIVRSSRPKLIALFALLSGIVLVRLLKRTLRAVDLEFEPELAEFGDEPAHLALRGKVGYDAPSSSPTPARRRTATPAPAPSPSPPLEWSPFLNEMSGWCFFISLVLLMLSGQILYFAETHIARIDSLLSRAEDEARLAQDAMEENTNRLVHIEGQLMHAMSPVKDPIFNVKFNHDCVRLRRTLEVYQVTKEGIVSNTEGWSEVWRNSSGNTKPEGLLVGFTTQNCDRVEYGNFLMPEGLISQCVKYLPAAAKINKNVLTCKCAEGQLEFTRHGREEYFYYSPFGTPDEPRLGDTRVKFEYVADMTVSIMAFQARDATHTDFYTLMPYRNIHRPWCRFTAEELGKELHKQALKSLHSQMEEVEIPEPIASVCCTFRGCVLPKFKPLLPEIYYASAGAQGMIECFWAVRQRISHGIVSRNFLFFLRVCIFFSFFFMLNLFMGFLLESKRFFGTYPAGLMPNLGQMFTLLTMTSLCATVLNGTIGSMTFLRNHPWSALLVFILYSVLFVFIVEVVDLIKQHEEPGGPSKPKLL